MLLSTALAGPAFAQIEEVVVTAQKRAEDVQTVPISITAYSAQDLAAHQIDQFKDLQFSTPNVSYTKGNFSGSDFQIRGIGITAVGYDAESGVAIHEDDVYLNAPPLAEAAFYDLDQIAVLRGPQSTLYGRGATGGTVNIITAKPQLDEFHADGEASYGNYNAYELKGMVNIPLITDQLGLRLAGDWVKHDGYTDNIFNGDKIDDRDQYSFRGSLRWQPTDRTTIDLVGSYSRESDNRMRSQKQLCATDPTGTLGCLPDGLAYGAVNINANLSTIASSVQGMESAGLPGALGLYDLTQPAGAGGVNPTDLRKVNTDFDPTYKADDTFFAFNAKQQLADWLDATLVLGYDKNNVTSQESYNNVPAPALDQTRLAIAEGTLLGGLTALGGPGYAALYAPYFSHTDAGGLALPISGVGNFGLLGNNIRGYSSNATAYDQSNNGNKEYSAELRFASKFDGPVNFLVAGYYLKTENTGDYYVLGNTLDYPAIAVGAFQGITAAPSLCAATGCLLGPSYYHNDGDYNRLESKSLFGEVYWDAIPDTLKFTAGLRYTDDDKYQRGRIALYSGLVPIGTDNENDGLATFVVPGQRDFDCSNGSSGAGVGCGNVPPPGPNDLWQINTVDYKKTTGRFVADYTPKLDFTDSTLIYASYARGYKAGGFNPGIETTGGGGVSSSYGPEQIDAYEFGTKNLLAGGTLQANADVWYYNYKGLQVSAIENNTSVNQNINAKLWGSEGEFLWAPSERWQFDLNVGYTHSSIGNSALIDDRNPTAGRSDVVLIKDATLASTVGQNCVLYLTGGQTVAPGDNAALTGFLASVGAANPYFAPPGGSSSIASHGVAHTNYGTCLTEANGGVPDAVLNAFGYSRTDPTGHGNGSGAFVDLKGNELQNTPDWTISLGAQYTQPLNNDYNLVARVDYYWQDDMWGRIFNDAADRIKGYDQWNAQLTLNAPDNKWYVQGFIKNIADSKNVTGMYLTSSTSGLYTNEFIGDPRTYGIAVGARF
jgi:outer membrane receptor protein involved in Fe transport